MVPYFTKNATKKAPGEHNNTDPEDKKYDFGTPRRREVAESCIVFNPGFNNTLVSYITMTALKKPLVPQIPDHHFPQI